MNLRCNVFKAGQHEKPIDTHYCSPDELQQMLKKLRDTFKYDVDVVVDMKPVIFNLRTEKRDRVAATMAVPSK